MKKILLFAFLSTVVFTIKAEDTDISGMDNVVYIEPCTAEAGSEYVLSVKMKNSVETEGFGFDLALPEGITVALDEYGFPIAELSTERTNMTITNHFDADFKLDGTLNIQAYSSRGLSISGHDGEVCLITINIATSMEAGTYPILLKNIAISDVNSITYTEDFVESSIEIVKSDGYTHLYETSTTAPSAATGVNVKVHRTINANEWSTIVLPFAMTETQVKTAFGDDVQLADFTGYDVTEAGEDIVGITVGFDDVTSIEANHPYIIKVGTAVTEFTVDGVNVEPEDIPCVAFGSEYGRPKRYHPMDFVGTYKADFDFFNDAQSGYAIFLSGGNFYYATASTRHMKAFRAYFDFDDILTDVDQAANVIEFKIDFDDATGIDTIDRSSLSIGHRYNLAGQRVGENYKGIVVTKGRKEVK